MASELWQMLQDQPFLSTSPPQPGSILNTSVSLCSLNIKQSLAKSSLKPGMDKYLKVINTQLSNYLEWSKGYNYG